MEKITLYFRIFKKCYEIIFKKNEIQSIWYKKLNIVNGNSIANKYGMNSVKVVNDFVACGYGLLTLNDEEDCIVIQVRFKVIAITITPTCPTDDGLSL